MRNQRKRQKALERKKAKRKAAKALKVSTSGGVTIRSGARDLRISARSPVHECLVPKEIFELGIGNVVIARRMPSGNFGIGVFLLDIYCLGVKDAFYATITPHEYTLRIAQFESNSAFEIIHPSCARKLIEGGVEYAKQFGFKPHRDYAGVQKIFGDIDPEACPRVFDYGRDGKPFYVSGPHDTAQKSEAIVNTLLKQCGPDGFHYLVPM